MSTPPSEFALLLEELLSPEAQTESTSLPLPPQSSRPNRMEPSLWLWSTPPEPPAITSAQSLYKVKKSTPPTPSLVKEVPTRPERQIEVRKISKEARYAAEHLYHLAQQECPSILKEFELRRLYRRLARRLHPDATIGASESETRRLAEQFRGLKASYERLRLQFKAY